MSYFYQLCFYFMFAYALLLIEGSRVSFYSLQGTPSLYVQVCQLVHRNPQSHFDSGIVLLMRACFYYPGGKRRFEVYEQILLLKGVGILESSEWKTWWWSTVEECWWALNWTQAKTHWWMMQCGWTCIRINNMAHPNCGCLPDDWWKPNRTLQTCPLPIIQVHIQPHTAS